jgi:hypothetical protein
MIPTPDRLGDGTPLTPVAVLRAAEAARIRTALGPMLTPCDRALLARYTTNIEAWSWSAALRVKTWLMQAEEIEEQHEAAWAEACA